MSDQKIFDLPNIYRHDHHSLGKVLNPLKGLSVLKAQCPRIG
jgi:hypothetical protein